MDQAGEGTDGSSGAAAAGAADTSGATGGAAAGTGTQGDAGAAAAAAASSGAGAASGDSGASGDAGKATDWSADWREKISTDEKHTKTLARFASPKALWDSYVALRQRMDSGDVVTKLPDNAKPDELTAWRKDNGIPETADKYDLKFDNGLVIGKEDKPIIDAFLKSAHEVNMRPDQVKAAINWYAQDKMRQAEEFAQRDEQQRTEAVDALNQEWGKDFRRNINLIDGLLSRFPEEVREGIKAARLPDGRGVFNHPDVMRAFAALALEVNPAGVLTPSGGGDIQQNLNDEIGQIEKWMGAPRKSAEGKKYWGDEKVQERYRTLLDARMKLQQKAA